MVQQRGSGHDATRSQYLYHCEDEMDKLRAKRDKKSGENDYELQKKLFRMLKKD